MKFLSVLILPLVFAAAARAEAPVTLQDLSLVEESGLTQAQLQQLQAADEGDEGANYPSIMHDGNYPSIMHDGNYPSIMHDGNYPNIMHDGSYPNIYHGGGQSPDDPRGEIPMPNVDL
jgi:hypothetical protein